jgi:predicted exporter
MFDIFRRVYTILAPKRFFLLGACAVVVVVCGLLFSRLIVREDIRTMLPDGHTQVASDFELLSNSPFTQRLTITVSHPGGNPLTAARILADALQGTIFPQVVTGPATEISPASLTRLIHTAPGMLTVKDIQTLKQKISPLRVHEALAKDFRTLVSPSGMALKKAISMDPLEIRSMIFPKFAAAARLINVRVENGQFVSRDGNHALVLADTDVPMTDSLGAARVMARYHKGLQALPPGATAILAAGHRHTLANAQTIKNDLKIILPASLVLLTLLFFCFLRTRQGLFVFLIPVAVVCIAGVGTSALYCSVSGIVLGFGAVLLGISVDFAVHVFYALRQPDQNPGQVLAEIARPVIFGALTSCAAFAALLISDIPGIRQLAVFSIFGLLVSLALSLLILPPFVTSAPEITEQTNKRPKTRRPPCKGGVIVAWAVILATGLWFGAHTQINGDLRELGYVPADIRSDEQATRTIWGGMREIAIVFAQGTTLEEALEANDRVWSYLHNTEYAQKMVSISPILPSRKTQTANIARWQTFWERNSNTTLATLAAQGKAFGFSAAAFNPFADLIQSAPQTMTAQTLQVLGAGGLLDMLTARTAGGVFVLTLLPDTPGTRHLFSPETEHTLSARFVSAGRFRIMLGHAMQKDVLTFGTVAFTAIALLTLILFRNFRKTAIALLPVGAGVTAVLAVMHLGGHSLNLFHIIAIPLVMGLGADYGIFMVCRQDAAFHHGTDKAVLFSALSTLAGFGALTLASHPALFSIGLTVLTGITAALIVALGIIPRLQGDRG